VLEFRWPRWAELGRPILIGSLGAYWTIQRTVMMHRWPFGRLVLRAAGAVIAAGGVVFLWTAIA
jgi:hypothetical protein